jgi:methionyl-tRNA formyltransferase
MGVLPRFRGMNVTEWATFLGGPVGCTVHLVDAGIDTGNILCVRPSDPRGARTIAELRARVDHDQIAMLGDVIQWTQNAGTLPPSRSQEADEGIQLFRMHPDLRAILEAELAAPPPSDASIALPSSADTPARTLATV